MSGFGTQFGVGSFGLDGSGSLPSYYSPIGFDDFTDGILPNLFVGGNGTWTEEIAGGGILWFSVPYGTDCDWWPTVGGSPQYRHSRAAYYDLGVVSPFKQVVAELQIHDFNTVDTGYTAWVFALWSAENNMVWIYGQDRYTVRAYSVYSGSQTYLGDIPFPSGTVAASKVRFVWDRVRSLFEFEAWDGTQWIPICNPITAGITPTRVVLGGKNWGSNFPSFTASYDQIYMYGIVDQRTGITHSRLDAGAEPTANAVAPTEGAWTDAGTGQNMGLQFPPTSAEPKLHFYPASQNQDGWADQGGLGSHYRNRHPSQVDNPLPFSQKYLDGDPRISPAAGGTHREVRIGGWGDVDRDVAKLTELTYLNFRRDTYDLDGHLHVTGEHFWAHSFLYDTTGEEWTSPPGDFTGYARSGYYYLNGVNQGSLAPWASETSGTHRSARPDFPVRSLVTINRNELTIYDLDSFPAQFRVWMRFVLGDAASYYLLGRVASSLTAVAMKDGIMAVTSKHNGIENGGLCVVNFKATNQNFVHLIRNDGHWRGVTGRNITHRNTTGNHTLTGVSPSLRVGPTSLWSVAQYAVKTGEAPDGQRGQMIAVGGNGAPPDVFRCYSNAPQARTTATGDDVGGSGSVSRCVCFDDYGIFYFTDGDSTVFRNIRDYFQFIILADKDHPRVKWVQLDYPINDLKHLKDQIYAGTGAVGAEQLGGVYRIERSDMRAWKAYTTVGGGGGGRLNAPPAGELMAGDDPRVRTIQGINLALSSYLAITTLTGSAATLIRLYDDVVLSYRQYQVPGHELADPLAYEAFVMSR